MIEACISDRQDSKVSFVFECTFTRGARFVGVLPGVLEWSKQKMSR